MTIHNQLSNSSQNPLEQNKAADNVKLDKLMLSAPQQQQAPAGQAPKKITVPPAGSTGPDATPKSPGTANVPTPAKPLQFTPPQSHEDRIRDLSPSPSSDPAAAKVLNDFIISSRTDGFKAYYAKVDQAGQWAQMNERYPAKPGDKFKYYTGQPYTRDAGNVPGLMNAEYDGQRVVIGRELAQNLDMVMDGSGRMNFPAPEFTGRAVMGMKQSDIVARQVATQLLDPEYRKSLIERAGMQAGDDKLWAANSAGGQEYRQRIFAEARKDVIAGVEQAADQILNPAPVGRRNTYRAPSSGGPLAPAVSSGAQSSAAGSSQPSAEVPLSRTVELPGTGGATGRNQPAAGQSAAQRESAPVSSAPGMAGDLLNSGWALQPGQEPLLREQFVSTMAAVRYEPKYWKRWDDVATRQIGNRIDPFTTGYYDPEAPMQMTPRNGKTWTSQERQNLAAMGCGPNGECDRVDFLQRMTGASASDAAVFNFAMGQRSSVPKYEFAGDPQNGLYRATIQDYMSDFRKEKVEADQQWAGIEKKIMKASTPEQRAEIISKEFDRAQGKFVEDGEKEARNARSKVERNYDSMPSAERQGFYQPYGTPGAGRTVSGPGGHPVFVGQDGWMRTLIRGVGVNVRVPR